MVFGLVYFFSLNGLAALPNLSINFLLKEQMKLSAPQLAYFQALTLAAWAIKPLWGFISDSFPIGGQKRKPYLLLTSFLALASWMEITHARPSRWFGPRCFSVVSRIYFSMTALL